MSLLDGVRIFNTSDPDGILAEIPHPLWKRLAAMVEAVERMVDRGQPNGDGAYCAVCGKMLDCDPDQCPWHALVAALNDEKAADAASQA